MCAIWGCLNTRTQPIGGWRDEQLKLALKRGADPTSFVLGNSSLFHTRLATNNSPDTYPIEVDDCLFAMNGIVSQTEYARLRAKYNIPGYSVDSAYMLKAYLDTGDWTQFDNEDYVFAFWLQQRSKVYLGNKDFPLFIRGEENRLWFSSFMAKGFAPLGNNVIEFDLKEGTTKKVASFNNLVYQI